MKNQSNNNVQNRIKRYNDLFYKNGPVKISDFLGDTYNKVHEKIYIFAIKEYLKDKFDIVSEEDIEKFLESHKLIEFKNTEYNLPGKVLIISRSYPYKKEVINLDEYWNYYSYEESNKKLIRKLDKDDESIRDAEITYINYITGEVEMESKYTGKKFKLPFNEITSTTPMSDELSLKNTYQYKLKHIN